MLYKDSYKYNKILLGKMHNMINTTVKFLLQQKEKKGTNTTVTHAGEAVLVARGCYLCIIFS